MAHPIQPAAVAVPAPPPLAGAIREAPRTYRELYADATNNPAPDRTAGYLAGYRFAGEGVIPVPIQLRDQTVAMSDRQPMAFLCLINGLDGLPEVSIVHRLLRFMDMPGDEPTGFHDKVLGLLGDILPHQYPAVETPASMFHLVNTPVRVPTVAAMEALLPAWVDPRTPLGPFTELDPETEVVRPRNTQLLPGRYAALIVHRRRITAKQAYQEIVGAIRADDALESCNDVVVWLRAACTARGGGGAQNALPSVHHPLVPLHMPPEVYQYVTQKVQTDLPALTATEGVGNAGTTATLIGALRALTQQREGGDDQQDRGRPARETKSIVDAYKETHRVLLRFCNVASPDDVAPIWQRLSNCHKSEQHTLLTQEMQKVCMARGLSTELYVPVVTTALKQMIVGFQFPGHSADDLSTGCQPFLVAYAGKAHHLQMTNSSAVANQLVQGEQNASLADIRTIREGEKIKFPQDITEVCVTLFRYAVLCQCLFQGVGPAHPYVEALWSTAVGLQNIAPFVTDRYHELAQVQTITRTYHARIVRAVQVNVHEYLQQVSTNVVDSVIGVEVPNFAPMLQELRRGTFHQSTNWMDLPVEYLDSAPQSGPAAAMTTGQASSMSSGASPRGATVGGQSNRTGVSSLSGDTASTAVARVSNPVSDNDFTALTLRAGGTRTILREHRPPTNDSGHEFCVAWWTKGGCFPNCGRRATHQPFASPGERRVAETPPEAAWLLEAPPWAARPAEEASRRTQTRTTNKRKAPEIASEAEQSLGKLAEHYAERLRTNGWHRTITEVRGCSNIAADVVALPHKAARLLQHLGRRGASVPTSTAPWSRERCHAAVQRGPHKSSQSERKFVAEEMLEFCQQGYWMVLPYEAVADLQRLRVSPLGVVPQRDRRPRLIVDYTFSGVNSETVQWAPREAMQFGKALQRVLTTLVHADPRYGPVYMAKIDVADGFYRVWVQIADVPKLGVILPTSPGCKPLIAFPLALPMGWVESPPYFTVLTETACDRANVMLSTRNESRLNEAHRLEAVAATPPDDAGMSRESSSVVAMPPTLSGKGRRPVAQVDVYVDDFLLMAQTHRQQQKVMRATLAAIDEVLRPLTSADPIYRKEPASTKKMLKGDACWATYKRILGWDIDSAALTLHLPAHRLVRVREVLAWLLPPAKRLSVHKWHQVLGELRSMSPALPGTRGLFSVLQEALTHTDRHRVRITQRIHDLARDFLALVASVHDRPTRLHELVPTSPSDVGACDACQAGMGGVWFDMLDPTAPPVVWRQRFRPHIGNALVTAQRPRGSISISDLELAAIIAHKDILAATRDVRERTMWIASDNRAAVAWSTKGSATSVAARSHLLRFNALHQRAHRYVARQNYIPGPVNAMADDASRHDLLADADPGTRHQCYLDWSAIQQTCATRVSRQRHASAATAWQLWSTFCASLGVDPLRTTNADSVPLLQLFAHRYRTGTIAPGRRPVRARTVEDALRAVGQAHARLGAPDPRLTPHGTVDFRLTSLLQAWQRADAPPSRVKPLPLGVVAHVWALAQGEATPIALATAHCLIVGFYFLLRPGEYLGPPSSTHLFRMGDVQLWIGSRALDHLACPAADLLAATFATLTFTQQKNGVRNERIGHGRSGHPSLCPVTALAARILALRAQGATTDTPLNAVKSSPQASFQYISPSDITSRIRSVLHLHPDPAYTAADVSVRSTRAGGAMALLCAGVDSDRIRMVGRWRSDEMYRYLHVQAQPVMTGLSAAMLHGGSFRLTPG